MFPIVPSTLWAPPPQSRASRASVSSCRARASVLWERLQSKRVTVGPYSPRRIGNSRIVPAVLTHHLPSSPVFCSPCPSSAVLTRHLQSSPITYRARQSSRGTRKIAPSETPAVPASPSRAVVRTDAKIPIRPGRPSRYRRPSRPDLKRTDWTLGNTACVRDPSSQIMMPTWLTLPCVCPVVLPTLNTIPPGIKLPEEKIV